ncbi:hypothetical protein LQ327_23095 [Actinomycetospora endophytica]|uniref:Uncharacterized protein n=1 Tax=Actinomycetospora endophytica TaxID=2291215 RepID=A0ABS8PDA9_9PSEU|nr:hypothetical protein [Actinomycetospora endophytica]MCD2196266.1 hypothetical protein [Actinomycetospora endophytica]
MAADGDDPSSLDEALHRVLAGGAGHRPRGYDPLEATVEVCLASVPAAEAVAISYVRAGRVRSTHRTDPAIAEFDRWHTERGRGPLLDAAFIQPWRRSFFAVADLAADAVWGADTPLPAAPLFRSLHSTTLRSACGERTALDLYARTPRAFGVDTTVLVDMFATRVSTLLYTPDDRVSARYDLAITTIGRRLGIEPSAAERLLLVNLEWSADPMVVADRLTCHTDDVETPEPD